MAFTWNIQGSDKPRDNDTILVVDGDSVSFQVACACEQRGILVTNTTNESQTSFKTRTEMKNFLHGLQVPEGHYDVVDTQIAEDVRNAFATIKAKLQNYRDKFNTDNLEIYMTGKGNFREDLLLPFRYKSNRDDSIRPLLLQDIRDYLVKYQGAVVIEGDEADAMLTQRMYDGFSTGKRIIASNEDKDLRQASGLLHNPNTDELLEIDGFGDIYLDDKGKLRGHGRKWLYTQVILGDKTDGFNPRDFVTVQTGKSPRYGDKQCFTDLDAAANDKEALSVVVEIYKRWLGEEPFTYKAWDGNNYTITWMEALQMIWDCAYMRRWEGDRPQVKDILKKMRIIE
jgi:hypothetical protein